MNARVPGLATSALWLPQHLQDWLDRFAKTQLYPPGEPSFDFSQPPGEAALISPGSVSWQIFKNPVSLFIGGVAAVILELADPAVRTGVWDHTSFRTDPVRRLQRTGLAAMITVYGAQSKARAMIAGVARLHARIAGITPSGETYHADDPVLLTWVQATAGFGFAESYRHYVRPLDAAMLDQLCVEGLGAAQLYGARDAPASYRALEALIAAKRARLEPSPIIFEFLDIMDRAQVVPAPMRPLQRMLVRAAVDLTPGWVRERLRLGARLGLRRWERPLVERIGALSDRIMLRSSPAVQSCLRLGLPADYLYRSCAETRSAYPPFRFGQ